MQPESLFSLGFSRPDANQVVIEEAERVANAHAFIIKLPEGYETQDVLTEQIQEIAPRCMLFADDIVLLGESREELNERLKTWRRALETHDFRLSRSKSEYMECKFNKRRRVSNSEVKIGDHIIPQVTRFKYLGSVIQDDGEIEGDVNHRIQAGWMKWRKASGMLCDAKVQIKLKEKFYRTAIRPAILYGTECWAVKSQHENKVGVAEMRMLRWMCGKTRQDKIRNEAIRERVGVAPIVEKMVENRLRWFGHVERRPVDSVVRRVDQMERRQPIRGRGRPKKTIREVIKKDLELNDLDRSMAIFLPVVGLVDPDKLKPDYLIQELVETIVLPMTHKERFQKFGVGPPEGVLLYGPPGTGKTLIAHACVAQANATFLKLAGYKYALALAKLVCDAFQLAKEKSPCIIFMDEIDAIGTKHFDRYEQVGI
ncbi:26S proteasome regulatory subunit 6A-like [Glycine soja]|uniref:26S proteasome regulatory subunit 6A-like n=1 Tax=Glycine soja TaxID=3848 RepID=A0A445F1U1_GLYSO|nr:26S proteasome regulatory subunit 6A-like [Glycine soja]